MLSRPPTTVPGKLQRNPIPLLNTVCQQKHCMIFVIHSIYFAHLIVMTVLSLQASQHIGTKQWFGPCQTPIYSVKCTSEKTSDSIHTVPISLITKLHSVTIQQDIISIFGAYKTLNSNLQTDVVSFKIWGFNFLVWGRFSFLCHSLSVWQHIWRLNA